MRKVVLGMMTTLNLRLDDPEAWIAGVGDDLFRAIDTSLEHECDTILIGRTTYDEMYPYWPSVLSEQAPHVIGENIQVQEGAAEINRSVARKMNAYKKFVFTRGRRPEPLAWTNAELVVAPTDEELMRFVADLKALPGRDVHLAGGAQLARSFVRLGLVDEYRLHVHPVLSSGATLFDPLERKRRLELLGTTTYDGGVVSLRYRSGAG
jgi:dihydrofolate reductase